MANLTVNEKFDLFSFHEKFNSNILLSYLGPFDKHILSGIGNYIKFIVSKNPTASKKIFKIFIELAQNIAYYSSERNTLSQESDIGIGTVVIEELVDYYLFATGNMVSKGDVEELVEKCDYINTLDRESLRQYKREQRNLPPGSKGCAHIGLITVALTSENPLEMQIKEMDEFNAFISIMVKIEK